MKVKYSSNAIDIFWENFWLPATWTKGQVDYFAAAHFNRICLTMNIWIFLVIFYVRVVILWNSFFLIKFYLNFNLTVNFQQEKHCKLLWSGHISTFLKTNLRSNRIKFMKHYLYRISKVSPTYICELCIGGVKSNTFKKCDF